MYLSGENAITKEKTLTSGTLSPHPLGHWFPHETMCPPFFQRVAGMILLCWLLSGLTGFVPVFTGIYSSSEHLDLIRS